MGLRSARQTGHASVEWVMGPSVIPDIVFRDRRQNQSMIHDAKLQIGNLVK